MSCFVIGHCLLRQASNMKGFIDIIKNESLLIEHLPNYKFK